MAQYDFTVNGNQLIVTLVPVDGDIEARTSSYVEPSIILALNKLKLYESGIYKKAFLFEDIGTIGGDTPTDLDEAKDLILALIANFSGGGGSPQSLAPYIRITDKNGDVFTNLSEARTYLDSFTDTSLFTNEAFNADSGIYQFTCPSGTSLAGADNFCGTGAEYLSFEDKWNLVTEFGNLAFAENYGNNEFAEYWGVNGLITTTFGNSCFDTCGGSNKLYGKYIFGDNAFANAGGDTNEKRGQYINWLDECGVNFASSYLGAFEILTWGASIASDIFTTSEIVIVKTPYANKYNNAGGINATVQIVIDNLALGNPNSVVSFDGVDDSAPSGGVLEAVYYIGGQDSTGFLSVDEKVNTIGTTFEFVRESEGFFSCANFDVSKHTLTTITNSFSYANYNTEQTSFITYYLNADAEPIPSDGIFEFGGWIFIREIN